MERWLGKVAVVTGASAGIGAVVCLDLARAGLIVIGLARRAEKVDALKTLLGSAKGQLIARQCDVVDKTAVIETFDWIEKEYGGVNVLINNAGVSRLTMILSDDSDVALQEVINTNLNGVLYCTKAAYKHMKKYDSIGHIININSIYGHGVPKFGDMPSVNIYPGTKHAITATTEVIRQELNYLQNKKVKITSISPGLVKTEIVEAAGYPNAAEIYSALPHLQAEDISEAILYVLGTPSRVQVHELIIKPVGESM